MRDMLLPHVGERRLFRATVKSITPTDDRPLVLLKDLLDVEKGLIVTDHVWVRYTDSMRAGQITAGQRIGFSAKIYRYHKKDETDQCGLREVLLGNLPQ